MTVSGNTVTNVAAIGILARTGANVAVTDDNRVSGGDYGIVFQADGTTGTIADNTIRDSASDGIVVMEGATATISGNTVTDPVHIGIVALAAAVVTISGNNQVSGGDSGIAVGVRARAGRSTATPWRIPPRSVSRSSGRPKRRSRTTR